jgi:hypothetical protein
MGRRKPFVFVAMVIGAAVFLAIGPIPGGNYPAVLIAPSTFALQRPWRLCR